MIINPVFIKSGKGLNSILKNQKEKLNTRAAKTLSYDMSKSPPNHLSVYSDKWQLWLE